MRQPAIRRLLALMACWCVGACANEGPPQIFTVDQFSAQQTVELPREILRQLEAHPAVRPLLDETGQQHIPPGWLVATRIRVSRSKRPEFLIMGQDRLLAANTAPFWIFGQKKGEYRVLLWVPALRFEILDSQTNGHHDIRATAVVGGRIGTVTFNFRSDAYRAGETVSQPIR